MIKTYNTEDVTKDNAHHYVSFDCRKCGKRFAWDTREGQVKQCPLCKVQGNAPKARSSKLPKKPLTAAQRREHREAMKMTTIKGPSGKEYDMPVMSGLPTAMSLEDELKQHDAPAEPFDITKAKEGDTPPPGHVFGSVTFKLNLGGNDDDSSQG